MNMRRFGTGGLGIVTVGAMLAAGCTTPYGTTNHTATGALMGTILGAGTGALIGDQSGHAGPGALIGAGAGLLAGTAIGSAMDQQQRQVLAAQSPQTLTRVERGEPLRLADVKALAAAKVGDEIIISQIRNSGTVYHLSATEIIELKEAGVSTAVIDYMINTPSQVQPAQTVPQSEAPPPVVETIGPAPGPGFIMVPGCWEWSGARWVWVRGYWARPPQPRAVWVPGGWIGVGRARRWVPGHWR
jgi:hypothetical protein